MALPSDQILTLTLSLTVCTGSLSDLANGGSFKLQNEDGTPFSPSAGSAFPRQMRRVESIDLYDAR